MVRDPAGLLGGTELGAVAPVTSITPDVNTGSPTAFQGSRTNGTFEWFFLLTDAGQEQGIWAKNGIDPEWTPTPGSAAQVKEQVASGIKIGFVNTAEVLLARSSGVPVKVVAGYFGPTIAKIFVKAD